MESRDIDLRVAERLQKALEKYPEFLSQHDLIEMKLYDNLTNFWKARNNKKLPPHIVINKKKIRFPKCLLIEWIISHKKTNVL